MSDPHVAQDLTADLSNRVAIHDLVVEFYREVVFDELLEPVFGEVAEVDWAVHIPKLVDYWCGILLGHPHAGASMISAHRRVHELERIGPEHCDRWYLLWVRSIDSTWSGPFAEHAKSHASMLMSGLAKRVFEVSWSAEGAAEGRGGRAQNVRPAVGGSWWNATGHPSIVLDDERTND